MKTDKEIEFIPYQVFLETYKIDRSTGDRKRKDGSLRVYRFGSGRKLYVKAIEIPQFFEEVIGEVI
jgi:hypothetical protein